MEQASEKTEPNQTVKRFDPRLYQIASLGTLLLYGLIWLHFEVSIPQVAVTFGMALLTQYAGTRLYKLPAFDPLSALVSALGLCIFLRTNDLGVVALASLIAIGSKFVIRWKGKHIFNPTNLALVVVIVSGLGWISPGQWGQVAWLGFLIACMGSLVVTRAARADVTLSFLAFYLGLLVARALWLGDPLTIPFHQIESVTLLIFSFFMISDPKTTPDSRAGRIFFTFLVAVAALFVQFALWRPNGPLWGLIACSPLVPFIDRLFPGARYDWSDRMLKKSASGVLASLIGSTYDSGRSYSGSSGRAGEKDYASPPRLLRPCWTVFLSILQGILQLCRTYEPLKGCQSKMVFPQPAKPSSNSSSSTLTNPVLVSSPLSDKQPRRFL
jgi:Na+-transporting NADH:ubiquinone oxidoreductase subunit NqrB